MGREQFADIIELIKRARVVAVKAVNTELIGLYWNVGAYISERVERLEWGNLWCRNWLNIYGKMNRISKAFLIKTFGG